MIFPFNLSYSAYSTYKKSPLQFFFQYIKHTHPSDDTIEVYGNAGNALHTAVEYYIKTGKYSFDQQWSNFNVDNQVGFRGIKLNKQQYKKMYILACKYVDKYREGNVYIPELRFEEEWYGVIVKGFIDVHVENERGNVVLLDWKTNSTHSESMHKDQRLFYSWVIWKRDKKIPHCVWFYLKHGVSHTSAFTEKELEEFDKHIQNVLAEIKLKGDDIDQYDAGDWKSPFNSYRTRCGAEVDKRSSNTKADIVLEIRGNEVFFVGDIDPRLERGIDFRTRFDLPDKYWMQEAAKKRGGRINLEEIGRIHLYNKRLKCFSIGLLSTVKNIIEEFKEYYGKEGELLIRDCRNKEVMEQKLGVQPKALQSEHSLRDYQVDAVNVFVQKKSGIVNIATGGGKTMIAGEIIRQIDGRTLWIIDRKELLEQTRNALTKLLGMTIGTIGGGVTDIPDVSIATIQTLNSKSFELQAYLRTINVVVIDEFHKSAAESYQRICRMLPNTKYRLGLTATVGRDDGKEPILYSILGDVVYKIGTQDLIKLGFLVRPKITFYNNPGDHSLTKYADDYRANIVEHDGRNILIAKLAMHDPTQKVLILTKQVRHGKFLCECIKGSKHIYGSIKDEVRTQIMDDYRNDKIRVLIMTISIGAEGLDIPNMDVIINAAGNKGDVKSIQVLGRVLRLFKGKGTAQYIDFVDGGKYTSKHSTRRIMAFEKQGHKINVK